VHFRACRLESLISASDQGSDDQRRNHAKRRERPSFTIFTSCQNRSKYYRSRGRYWTRAFRHNLSAHGRLQRCVGMPSSDSYGEAFGKRLSAQATSFATRALPRATIAVTELQYENPQGVLSTPPMIEDAYLVAVHFKHFPRYQYWENGKAAPVSILRPGETIIYDVKRLPTFHLNSSFHSVHFYFPRTALDALADEADAPRIGELRYKPAVSHRDPVLRGMAEALLPLFRTPDLANRLLVDHLMLTVGYHVTSHYGGMQPPIRRAFGGLTRIQERRAKELLTRSIAGDVPLSDLARECGLSLTSFSRAFRKTVGIPPHRWVIQQRIELAKTLLRGDAKSLAEIALECGFSDQSHFTRFFTAAVGVSPGFWRQTVKK
jgi:AraC family transcriptional regulator